MTSSSFSPLSPSELQAIWQAVGRACDRLAFIELTEAEAKACGGYVRRDGPALVVAVAHSLIHEPDRFSDVYVSGADLLRRQEVAEHYRALADRLRILAERAEATHLRLQTDNVKDALSVLAKVQAAAAPKDESRRLRYHLGRILALGSAFLKRQGHHDLLQKIKETRRKLRERTAGASGESSSPPAPRPPSPQKLRADRQARLTRLAEIQREFRAMLL